MKEKINPNVVKANVWRWRQDHGKVKTVARVQRIKERELTTKQPDMFVSSIELNAIHRKAAQFGARIPL